MFELDSFLIVANLAFVFYADQGSLDRARQAIHDCVDRARPEKAGGTG